MLWRIIGHQMNYKFLALSRARMEEGPRSGGEGTLPQLLTAFELKRRWNRILQPRAFFGRIAHDTRLPALET